MIFLLYNLLFPIVFLLMLPKFLLRMRRRGGYRNDFEQRFGTYSEDTLVRFEETGRIWVHAVSVGEIHIALRFIEEYRVREPDARFVLSTNTSTAHKIGREQIDARDVLIYFPIDLLFVMKRVFNTIQPVKVVLVECEFWLNLIYEAERRGVPVSLINGRISDSSFKNYRRFHSYTRSLLRRINPICVQGRQDAERVLELGAHPETVKTLSTAKYDLPPPAVDLDVPAREVLRRAGVADDALIWVGGSTWPGEEEALCRIYKTLRKKYPRLFLVLVPRHVERRDHVVAAVEGAGLRCSLRSQGGAPADVLVVDTTGELMSFYAAADLVFVGKSLCEHGGQNPIEPALLGKPVVVGPNMENFPAVMDDFASAEALCQVQDFQTLEKAVAELLDDSVAREELGAAAAELVESRRGVISEMVREVAVR